MRPFDYERATDVAHAVSLVAERPNARFLGGGTNLVDLVRRGVETPDSLVDVTGLPLAEIEATADGGLRVGAVVTNADLAHHPLVRTRGTPCCRRRSWPARRDSSARWPPSGGNLLQRTRCPYFTDLTTACNKREPGSGCAAREGFTRYAAVLGASDHCVAVHPSDMAVALAALDARVELTSSDGVREVAVTDLYRLPGETPQIETVLSPGELVTAVVLPPPPAGGSRYRKVRDRASYAFALVSVAAVLRRRRRPDHHRRGWPSGVSPRSRGGPRPPSRCSSVPSRRTRRSPRRSTPSSPTRNRCPATSSSWISPVAPWSP